MRFSRAIVCAPAPTFANGLTSSAALGRPDVEKALEQHRQYCRALGECGLEIVALPPDERYPDGTFVEDTAVVAQRVAVVTRPGAESRAGEVSAVATALRGLTPELERIEPPGTVDGGDVCQAEEHFLIGISERTNAAGAAQLTGILVRHGYSASTVDIRRDGKLLHLKSGIAYLGDRRFVLAPGFPRVEALEDHMLLEVDAAEAYAANCVRVNDAILLPRGYPRIAERLADLGYTIRLLDVSEFQKMDGGLSCLSVRF
ncbi:MAG TPA: arginine deiminase family protein [Steroidobacteraceae bacterium]|nr:arginine deiminase family protein [Steroidobacteraceae bacterium]